MMTINDVKAAAALIAKKQKLVELIEFTDVTGVTIQLKRGLHASKSLTLTDSDSVNALISHITAQIAAINETLNEMNITGE